MKLKDWLRSNKVSQADFAQTVEVDQATISRLIPEEGKRQRRSPSLDLVARIERATGGEVTARDFIDDHVRGGPQAA